ncbi:hypothetical protein FI667_g11559, partial [Globisporangium splendens]
MVSARQAANSRAALSNTQDVVDEDDDDVFSSPMSTAAASESEGSRRWCGRPLKVSVVCCDSDVTTRKGEDAAADEEDMEHEDKKEDIDQDVAANNEDDVDSNGSKLNSLFSSVAGYTLKTSFGSLITSVKLVRIYCIRRTEWVPRCCIPQTKSAIQQQNQCVVLFHWWSTLVKLWENLNLDEVGSKLLRSSDRVGSKLLVFDLFGLFNRGQSYVVAASLGDGILGSLARGTLQCSDDKDESDDALAWKTATQSDELETVKTEVLEHYPAVVGKFSELVPSAIDAETYLVYYIYKASLLAVQEQRGADLLFFVGRCRCHYDVIAARRRRDTARWVELSLQRLHRSSLLVEQSRTRHVASAVSATGVCTLGV